MHHISGNFFEMEERKKGMDFCGASIWKTIHSEAVTYMPENRAAYKAFIESQVQLLPCKKCRAHLKENLQKIPIDPYLTDNHSLFFWTYLLHDIVNKSLSVRSPPYDKIKAVYFQALKSECSNCSTI